MTMTTYAPCQVDFVSKSLSENPFAGGIYAILNKKTGDCYIGSTKLFVSRFNDHRKALMLGKSFPLLQSAFYEHGKDAFVFRIVEVIKMEKQDQLYDDDFVRKLGEREQYWIDKVKPTYNRRKKAGRAPLSNEWKRQRRAKELQDAGFKDFVNRVRCKNCGILESKSVSRKCKNGDQHWFMVNKSDGYFKIINGGKQKAG